MRRFNRFYTRQIGLLRKTYLDSSYSLGEMRVLYEIAHGGARTASDIARALELDAGYLSRVLRHFEKLGLITRKTSARDARESQIALTARGRKNLRALEKRSQQQAGAMLAKLKPAQQAQLIAAMQTIESLLGGQQPDAAVKPSAVLRAPRHGDFGWIVARHAELYAQEYGWTEPFEGLCAQIVADFVNNYDAETRALLDRRTERRECRLHHAGQGRAPGVARIRLLLVDPKGRGLGLGARLADECVRFARAAGYKKITLWTHSNLKAARHIYQKAGFKLMRSEKHKSWGKTVVSEYWDLEL